MVFTNKFCLFVALILHCSMSAFSFFISTGLNGMSGRAPTLDFHRTLPQLPPSAPRSSVTHSFKRTRFPTLSSLFDPETGSSEKLGDTVIDSVSFPSNQTKLKVDDKNYDSIESKGEVLLYRFCLLSASIGYTLYWAFIALDLSSISGVDAQRLAYTCHAVSTWGMLLSALFSPTYLGAITDQNENNDFKNACLLVLNEALPQIASFAIIVQTVNLIQMSLSSGSIDFLTSISGGSLENTTIIFIVGISLREIGFYGFEYKAEAVLAIFIFFLLTLSDVGISETALSTCLALCLLVLSFGKLFEPIKDDLRPNESKFFQNS